MDYRNFFLTDNKSGKKTNEKYIIKNHIEIYEKINSFIKKNGLDINLSFKEKVYHFINNITEEPKCLNCDNKLKFKRTLKEGYGSFCSVKCNNQSDEHKKKVKQTFKEKYNGHPMYDEEIRNKIKQTNQIKYGVDNIFEDKEYIQRKTKEKLGVHNPNKLKNVRDKIKDTNLKKYGVTTNLLLDSNRNKNQISKLKGFNEKYKSLNIINDKGNYITIKCDECNDEYEIDRSLLFYRFDNNLNCCTRCNGVNELKSIKEKELIDYINSLGITTINGDRKILNGKEIDILIPTHNIGIEFNGLYYHSDVFKDKDYHINKTKECSDKGIHLIHIFEDEWDNKKDIVKSRIKNLLRLNDIKIYGRKCIIKPVPTKEKTKFLNDNHIQGTVGSNVNYGLYYNDELVSIMTFGKGRKIMNGLKYEWELLRFCNKLNHSVIGGASKLLKHFIKNNNPKNIVSYADIRWSYGNLYNVLGFNLITESKPNYFYIINRKREHRFKYRKDILVSEGYDENLTENQIMYNRGINRIYDCGNLVYTINL